MNENLDKYFDTGGSIFVRNKENLRKDGGVTVPAGLNIRRKESIKKFHENSSITDEEMLSEIEEAVDR